MGDPEPRVPTAATVVDKPEAQTIPAGYATGSIAPGGPGSSLIELPPHGYRLGPAIGRGGMGEVHAAYDVRIGREVAIKRIRATTPSDEGVARFLREARVQARLDHPAIVPVHELSTDEGGRPYFTMKRLTGRTFGYHLTGGASLARLLRAFAEVCLAIEFAHARGVIHRDLKPSNIMLGDYGEVYVLDWGVARVLAEPDHAPPDETVPHDIESLGEGTQTGALLGTPGYIAPEALKGDPATRAADVYALGAILFEVLTGESLHSHVHQRAVASTLTAPQQLPSARTPDRAIPPELDALCHAALAEDPAERPSARALGERVQAYLDGDRDMERRRTLADGQLRDAEAALRNGGPEAHISALRLAGRALALDPESRAAADVVGALLLEPPAGISPALAADLEEHERQINRDRSRKAVYAYASVLLMVPLVLALEVKTWATVIGLGGGLALGVVASLVHARTGRPSMPLLLALNLVLAVLFARIAGPFILTPVLICCVVSAMTSIPWLNQRTWAVVAWTVAIVMAPFAIEWAGVLPPTWTITDQMLAITGDVFYARGGNTAVALIAANLVFTLVAGLLALAIARRRLVAQRQLYIQAWHLRQLLPTRAA